MTHIKKLFLTLSLFAMQSAFGMDPVTKRARTGDSEWTLVTEEQDLEPWAGKFAVIAPLSADERPFFVRPFQLQPIGDNPEHSLYEAIDCKGEIDLLSSHLTMGHWELRGLDPDNSEELPMVKLGREVNYAYREIDYVDREIDYVDDEQPVPNEIRLDSLMRSKQTGWIVKEYLKFPVPLLAMKKFERSGVLCQVPNDVVRYICKLAIADARRKNPVVRSIE